MNSNRWIAIGALSGALSVALGAFGAHALKDTLAPEQLAVWTTAVHYQALHALALIAFGAVAERWSTRSCAAWCFLIGTLLFSGSLYALSLGAPRWSGAITPFGGVAFIAGWLAFAWSAWRAR
jgi:uncharacterized membrane protein YgdD (TMEM256/DUF423 family)